MAEILGAKDFAKFKNVTFDGNLYITREDAWNYLLDKIKRPFPTEALLATYNRNRVVIDEQHLITMSGFFECVSFSGEYTYDYVPQGKVLGLEVWDAARDKKSDR